VPDLKWRVSVRVADLGRVLDARQPAGVDELLQEDPTKDAVDLLTEARAEDDGDAVVRGLDVDGLVLAIVDLHQLARLLALAVRWCRQRRLGRKRLEEGRRERERLEV
jgi:hypothetical protein